MRACVRACVHAHVWLSECINGSPSEQKNGNFRNLLELTLSRGRQARPCYKKMLTSHPSTSTIQHSAEVDIVETGECHNYGCSSKLDITYNRVQRSRHTHQQFQQIFIIHFGLQDTPNIIIAAVYNFTSKNRQQTHIYFLLHHHLPLLFVILLNCCNAILSHGLVKIIQLHAT